MGKEWNDVHLVVSELGKMATGQLNFKVVDTASFINFGERVMKSNDLKESFLDALVLRISMTYDTVREYQGKLRSLLMTGAEWGAIIQKINGDVPDFVEDETFKLEEGKSVDQYIVRKPKAAQKFFMKKATYSNYVTWSKKLLQGAFTSEAAFARFYQMIAIRMNSKLNLATENLGKMAMAAYMASAADSQKVHLLTEFAAMGGKKYTDRKAYLDKDFLAWSTGIIELRSKRLSDYTVTNNAQNNLTFTPRADMRLVVYDEYQNALQHELQYQAYHDNLVQLGAFEEISYWQSEDSRMKIGVTIESDDTEEKKTVEMDNIVAFAFDRYALGARADNTDVLTTPINARGRYANTFYHKDSLWFCDTAENGVIFLLD